MTEEFNKWWNSDGLVEGNPYRKDSPAYWAWEGWQAAYEQTICANCAKEIHNCARCGEVNPAEIHTCTPKREWQGLTDDEIKEIVGGWKALPIAGYTRKLFDQIEAKLKEKNT